jgi:heme a synthase
MSLVQTVPAATPASPSEPQGGALLRRFAWGLLVYNIAPVILWGALVRATGSGNGCGDHWPLCNGVLLQKNPHLATMIELIHRMTSGLAVLGVLVLVRWTFRSTARGHIARIMAVAATVLTFNEALLGALLVLLRLTADNQSPARSVYLSLHLANTLLLLAALALAAHFLSHRAAYNRRAISLREVPMAVVGLSALLLVGVTGTLAALGDTLFPVHSLRAAFAQDFSGASSWLLRLRFIHPLTAVIAGIFICWLLFRAVFRARNRADRALGRAVLLLLALQCGFGIADVVLLAPVWLQIVHLLGADVLWVSLVVLTARVCVLSSASPAALRT